MVFALLIMMGCSSATPVGEDAGPHDGGDGGATHRDGDTESDADEEGPERCFPPRLVALFSYDTDQSPLLENPSDMVLSGRVTYVGPVRDPIGLELDLDQEVALAHVDGTESIMQFLLPLGIEVPVLEGEEITVTFHERVWGHRVPAFGVVVERQTSGLIFLIALGTHGGIEGRAFNDDELWVIPIRATMVEDEECAPREVECCGELHQRALLLESISAGEPTQVLVRQGETSSIPIGSNPFTVVNLESTQCEGYFCADLSSNDHFSYILVMER